MLKGAIEMVKGELDEAKFKLWQAQNRVLYWEGQVGKFERELYNLRAELKKPKRKKKQ